ncbi:MAG: hypothetical protein NZ741_12990, partial [Armatimonadetes bacterium]|nr:hypothetical protein [Armatimonadota bacterium]
MQSKVLWLLLLWSIVVGCHAQSPTPRPSAQAGLVWVWWEGEKPSATNFPDRHPFDPANAQEASVLSEGKWIGVDGNYGGQTMFLEYEVRVPQTAEY